MAQGLQKLSSVTTMYWKGLIYGGPGVGKTILGGTSKRFRTFVFDIDEGISSANAYLTMHGRHTDKERIDFWPVVTLADFYRGFDYLMANIKKYDLAVVDTATELQRLIVRHSCELTKHASPERDDWGNVQTISEGITVKFRNHVPLHVLFMCHEMTKADGEDMPSYVRPSFQGAFKSEYARHFSFIGRYMKVQKTVKDEASGKLVTKVTRAIKFGPDPQVHTKDRSMALSDWEEPDVDKIFDKLIGSTKGIYRDEQEAADGGQQITEGAQAPAKGQ